MDIGIAYLEEALRSFRGHQRLAEAALAQISDEEFFRTIDPESNSIAVLVKHISGNMRSRWTDFLTSDGEKPDRRRDQEFIVEQSATRSRLMEHWHAGWNCLFGALQALTPADLSRTVTIRGQEHTVLQAINRALAHYASHIGQIVYLAKHLRSSQWKTLSVPRGQSEQFNQEVLTRKPKDFHHP